MVACVIVLCVMRHNTHSRTVNQITRNTWVSVCIHTHSIFIFIFQLSLSQKKVPGVWKESVVVPVAKVPSPKVLNDYCPMALTSLVMEGFEHIVKRSLLVMT